MIKVDRLKRNVSGVRRPGRWCVREHGDGFRLPGCGEDSADVECTRSEIVDGKRLLQYSAEKNNISRNVFDSQENLQ